MDAGRRAGALARLRLAAGARPAQTIVACATIGLLLTLAGPVAALAGAFAAASVLRPSAVAFAAALALLAGWGLGGARLHALDRTALGDRLGHVVTVDAVLVGAPREGAYGSRSAPVEIGGERVLVRAARGMRWPAVEVGARLRVRGVLARLSSDDGWLRATNVHARLRAWAIIATGARRRGLAGVVDSVRARSQRGIESGLSAPRAALLIGMALGDDSRLGAGVRADFRTAGLTHLVAASGQNVMLLAALALGAAVVLGLGRRARLLLVLALIALYVPLAGAGPSIQRAGVMGAAAIAAALAGRPADRRHVIVLAAFVTLALDPRAVQQVGWQLSFAAVLGIVVLAPRLRAPLSARGVPGALADAIAVTTAATIATAPLIALRFDQASIVTLPANVLATPAVAPAMWLGIGAAAAGQVAPWAAAAPAALAALPVAFLLALAHAAARAPAAQLSADPAVVAGACAIAGVLVVARGARLRAAALGAAALLATALVALAVAHQRALPAQPAGLRVTFLDIGQGDATLLQHRGNAILVDSGPPEGRVVSRLRAAGVRRLDVLVMTHAQADHDGGAAAVLRAFPVGLVLDGRDGIRDRSGLAAARAARDRGVALVPAAAGQLLRAGGLSLRVLWPPADAARAPGADPNQRAIVSEARADGVRTLLTADAESDVLTELALEPVDILKVSHHGSDDSGLPELLGRLRPRLAAIEVGRGNTFGHPTPNTLRALAAARVPVVRTDDDGTVAVEPVAGGLDVERHR